MITKPQHTPQYSWSHDIVPQHSAEKSACAYGDHAVTSKAATANCPTVSTSKSRVPPFFFLARTLVSNLAAALLTVINVCGKVYRLPFKGSLYLDTVAAFPATNLPAPSIYGHGYRSLGSWRLFGATKSTMSCAS